MINGARNDGIATDIISGIQTRRSMQARRSLDPHRISLGSNGYGREADRQGLMRDYDEEESAGLGLSGLAEDSEDEMSRKPNGKLTPNGNGNGNPKKSFSEPIDRARNSSSR